MNGFWAIVRLEFVSLVRSRTLAILSVLALAWMIAAPHLFKADGTVAGARELVVRFSLGGVTLMLAVTLLVTAAGSLSRERTAKRLQLTLVRPIRRLALILGKIAAISLAGAFVLALAAVVECVRQSDARRCNSVYRPILPSPREEARMMYEAYMKDPATPQAVRHAKKSVVMRLLTQRAIDHFQTISTNAVATWRFGIVPTDGTPCAVRFRFTNPFEMRDDVRGILSTDNGYTAFVSNITQAVVTIPLQRDERVDVGGGASEVALSFANGGKRPLMLRPRRDIEFRVAEDGFRVNLVRAYLELVGMLTLLVAFGVFLGATLSRPVAVFVAIVVLALSEMTPSVLEQYPDELETNRVDAIGLSLARFTAAATKPIGSIRPLEALADDERVEPRDVVRVLTTDVLLLPLVLAALAAWAVSRKQDGL